MTIIADGAHRCGYFENNLLIKIFKESTDMIDLYPPGCEWYDKVLCSGETIVDLHRWWFLTSCSAGRLSVTSRSWADVRADPRFKP